jgi:hypothetical protein
MVQQEQRQHDPCKLEKRSARGAYRHLPGGLWREKEEIKKKERKIQGQRTAAPPRLQTKKEN